MQADWGEVASEQARLPDVCTPSLTGTVVASSGIQRPVFCRRASCSRNGLACLEPTGQSSEEMAR